jgi:hypothetical protein
MSLRAVSGRALAFVALPFAFLAPGASSAKAACAEPAALAHSTVSITKIFSKAEKTSDPALQGIRGTGWFLSPKLLATAAHVSQSMGLSEQRWTEVEIAQGQQIAGLAVRLRNVAGPDAEKIAVIELKDGFPAAQSLPVRSDTYSG